MSTRRFIHPSIWQSEDFTSLSPLARLLFIGCFSTADDHGRRKASSASIKAEIFPLDDLSFGNISALLEEVEAAELIRTYFGPESRTDVTGVRDNSAPIRDNSARAPGMFLDLPNWGIYQKPKYMKPSRLPSWEDRSKKVRDNSAPIRDNSALGLGRVGLGWVGKGRDGLEGVGLKQTRKTTTEQDLLLSSSFLEIPEALKTKATEVGVNLESVLGALERGSDEQKILAWVLAAEGKENPAAYFAALSARNCTPNPNHATIAAKAVKTGELPKPKPPENDGDRLERIYEQRWIKQQAELRAARKAHDQGVTGEPEKPEPETR